MSIPDRIFANYEENQEDSRRIHLGASLIGHECARHIFYAFRWVLQKRHSGRLLRLFETGKQEEERVFRNLRAIGLDIDSSQVGFETLGGHFAGSVDGIINGDTLLEIKTHSGKNFAKLAKDGVPKRHFDQMQVYMGAMGLQKGLYFAVNKDTDDIFTAEVLSNPEQFDKLSAKARSIIFATTPPEKISADPAFYVCKMCDFSDVCNGSKKPHRNCRTCLHSTVSDVNGWLCEANLIEIATIAPETQRTGCSQHRYMPTLIGEVDDILDNINVVYKNGWTDDGR